jgi:signal transduction histidine kinase
MPASSEDLFDVGIWRPALENYGSVTGLSVAIYDHEARLVCGPLPSSPLFAFFLSHGYEPGILRECLYQSLRPARSQAPVIVCQSHGLAVVGASLVLDGRIVGAAVGGYALVEFCQSSALASMAHRCGLPFRPLWEVAIQVQPMPERRLTIHGALLKVLGDSILREHDRTLQLRVIADELDQRVRERTLELASANRSLGLEIGERRDAEARVQKLLARVVVAQEEERHRIARDIHDHLGQEMIGLKLRIEALQVRLAAESDEWQEPMDAILALLAKLDADVDRLTGGLRPLLVQNLGLMRALAAIAADWSRRSGVTAHFTDSRGNRGTLRAEAETHLFRIAQETLSNIQKHANATHVVLRLDEVEGMVTLTIEDDGQGFDTAVSPPIEGVGGMGLIGMRERAALMRGTLSIESRPGTGTRIVVSVPSRLNKPAS